MSDCQDLEDFLDRMDYQERELDIYPGFPHGFLEFASRDSAKRFMDKLPKAELDGLQARYQEISFRSKPKTAFFFYSKLTKRDMNQAHGNDLPNATSSVDIPGLILIENFITEAEEQQIFEAIDKRDWHKLATRRVQHDGYEFVYGENNVNPNNKLGPLPDWIQATQKKLEAYCDKVNGQGKGLDQLTINDYQPGDGIPPHVDAIGPFEEAFAAVSMGSGAVMNFRHPDGRQANVYYPPRSAVVFTGEGRLVWQHSIACRKLDRVNGKLVLSPHQRFRGRRVSLTFRKVRDLPPGEHHIMSDSKGNKIDFLLRGAEDRFLSEQISKFRHEELPTEIEKKYVYDVYNKIAPHFSSTRYKPWPQVVKFLDSLPENSLVADVGCGNGKYLKYDEHQRLVMVGTDIAENLLKICKQRGCEVFTADSLLLPIKSSSFDHAISIAVIHHFSNSNQRKRALKELLRIIRPGGKLLVTVWAFEQNKKFPKQDLFVPWNLQDNFHQKNLEDGIEDEEMIEVKEMVEKDDKLVDKYHDDEKHAVVYKRYYHLFVKGELQTLLEAVPNAKVVDSFYNRDNWCVIIQKDEE